MDTINILHLSDLHFGSEKDNSITAYAQRENILNDLIQFIKKEVPSDLQPHIVVISGDIGWTGKKEDYIKAQKWISNLLSALKLDAQKLILCCGNHDIDREKSKRTVIPNNDKEADECLALEELSYFTPHFEEYEIFCKGLGIQQLVIDEHKNYLIGKIDLDDFRFVVLNTAWFYRKNNTKDLWIGLPQLQLMKNKTQLRMDKKWTIAVLHHPPENLNYSEIHSTQGRVCSYQYLAENVDIILSGHTHDVAVLKADTKYNEAPLIIGGATYSGTEYRNNFSILQINKQTMNVKRQSYEYNPSKGIWRTDEEFNVQVPHKKKHNHSTGIPKKSKGCLSQDWNNNSIKSIIENAKQLERDIKGNCIRKEIINFLKINGSSNVVEIISVLQEKNVLDAGSCGIIFSELEKLTGENVINNPFEYDLHTGEKKITDASKIYILDQ